MIKIACVLLVSYAALAGQTFEVASVKPSDPNSQGTHTDFQTGTFHATGVTAKLCIILAYDIQAFQVAGGPGWIANDRYDIVAKAPAGQVKAARDPARIVQMRTGLQALLADRFQLTIHRETKLMPAYVLVAAKNGFKLKEVPDNGRGTNVAANSTHSNLKAQQISMESLASNLSWLLNSPVVNMTGIQGVFDLTLQWTPDEGAGPADPAAPAGPSIFTALQEQLGLKLETQKAPVEMIVIDRIEKPTEN
jgi:uncharacterized protein (TIGR03435 family)